MKKTMTKSSAKGLKKAAKLEKKKETLFDVSWNNSLELLKKFKKKFHHTNVPQYWKENIALGRWVIKQRVHKDTLSPERIEKLDQLGFVWSIPDHVWNLSYQKLIEFKQKFGHCEVPKGNEKYMQLAEWVGKQRRDRRKGMERLTPQKIAKLNKIGFHWGRENTPWEERFEELVKFKKRFKHTRVPQKWGENKPLANWVSIQRRNKSILSRDRVKKLNQIGFIWKVRG